MARAVTRGLGAIAFIELIADHGSFAALDTPIAVDGPPSTYKDERLAASAYAGTDESVITGRGRLDGRPVVFIASEFRFLGGSLGVDSARRIVNAFSLATCEQLPVLAFLASGGTRMQEGTPAFVRMIDIARAVAQHRSQHMPCLVHLRHPTTGGALASLGSLGQIITAEPDAFIGLLGPRVIGTLTGSPLPPAVQVAENLAAKGVIDAVVPASELRPLLARVLRVVMDPTEAVCHDGARRAPLSCLAPPAPGEVLRSIARTRGDNRIGVREFLAACGTDVVPLRGTHAGESDDSVVAVFARIAGQPCVLIGQDRHSQRQVRMGPAALRIAQRVFGLAQELGLPVFTIVDTPGARISVDAEEGALAGEIARCMAMLSTLTVPVISVLLGEGSGGGAIALLAGDRVIALENSWLAPLAPEGASAILFGNADHAAEMAAQQRISARSLQAIGMVDTVIPEQPADAQDPSALAWSIAAELLSQLRDISATAFPAKL